MKKLTLTVLAIILAQICNAQLQSGTWSLTGAASYSNSNSKSKDFPTKNRNTSFSFKPSIGYFIKDNFEVGIIGGYSESNNKRINYFLNGPITVFQSSSKIKDGGLYTRYYKFLTDNFALYGQLDTKIHSTTETSLNTSTHTKSSYKTKESYEYYFASLQPGLMLMLSRKLSLNVTYGVLGYTHSKRSINYEVSEPYFESETEDNSTTSNFGLNLTSSSSSIGLSFYF
ncbi:hypothetical protein [uncultured Pontibacter sp.]|uniref:hypothetical protein n=1 Tax=uncultured Pontibacter sp. TaxID=453356 RepID=UPI00261B93FC|nr:hypothetical protein [uncultured Pontibacter sp.]